MRAEAVGVWVGLAVMDWIRRWPWWFTAVYATGWGAVVWSSGGVSVSDAAANPVLFAVGVWLGRGSISTPAPAPVVSPAVVVVGEVVRDHEPDPVPVRDVPVVPLDKSGISWGSDE